MVTAETRARISASMIGKAHRTYAYHGMTGTPTYRCWQNMIQRCTNPKKPAFQNWGARGITVCDRWFSFVNFFEDMGTKPDGLELDRIDNAKGYEPSNCRWVTHGENQRNKRPMSLAGRAAISAGQRRRLQKRPRSEAPS